MSIKKRLELIGWALFTAGSGVFLTDGIIRGNTVVAVGSAAFLIRTDNLICERYI